jgi:cytochrome c-type biogenesis protein CcmH
MDRIPLFILAVALLGAGLATAQPEAGLDTRSVVGDPQSMPITDVAILDAVTDRVAGIMRCPTCQGLSVADSPAESAQNMKKEVRDLLAQGYTEDQVLAYFERAYGEFIRLAPTRQGFNMLVWLAPLLIVMMGLGVVVARVTGGDIDVAAGGEVPDELVAYVERVRREVGTA